MFILVTPTIISTISFNISSLDLYQCIAVCNVTDIQDATLTGECSDNSELIDLVQISLVQQVCYSDMTISVNAIDNVTGYININDVIHFDSELIECRGKALLSCIEQ